MNSQQLADDHGHHNNKMLCEKGYDH